MSIKDDLKETKEEIQELKEQSFALDLLRDYKKQNKRQFVVILVILSMWFITIGLFVYYINTTGYEVVTETADTEGEGNACVGDKCNNGEINMRMIVLSVALVVQLINHGTMYMII